ncbi:SLC13 family permease [Hyunsoonleella aestuarii]|uniref:SLC13 family permease n=1 Tax=Hyunsoonleella aestuarii TaxID=912802 RepID=A0ABP8E9Q9_9FLAO|nr:DASS family sodium-coupled anion symporter [Hyunsoonleella aestuarii]
MNKSKVIGFWGGIAILLILLIIPAPQGMQPEALRALGVALLMAIWWVTECIPIYATAFVPIALFPLLGILDANTTTENYGHNYVLMLLGGFFLAKSIELSGLHKRVALYIISKLGTSRKRIILSFMIATAFLSFWIANVAVVLLMLPIALAIVDKEEENEERNPKFGLAMMLAIAYAASIGGTGSLIGTPPNMVFAGVFAKAFPDLPEIDFLEWMKLGTPIVIIILPIIWFYLTRYFKIKGNFAGSKEIINREIESIGKLSVMEKRVLAVFIFTAVGWIFRRDIILDSFVIPGWSSVLGIKDYVHDSTVAIISALLLFAIPSGIASQPNKPKTLLDWRSAAQVPWGVVMIVGGGYAIADSFNHTGLATYLGSILSFIGEYPMIIILLAVIFLMIFITEINSNTATANIFLPVLAAMAVAGQMNPLLLMIPATFACSFSFMLPSGTGTNAVIFASNRVSIPDMAKCGVGLNLLCVLLLTMLMYLYVLPVLSL